jgi:transcriptional regulator with XRE-family HTH domain
MGVKTRITPSKTQMWCLVKIMTTHTDETVLRELGARIERTRLERDLTQAQVADAASVGLNTLRRLEAGQGATLTNLIRVLRALDLIDGLDQVVPEPVASPIQQLRIAGARRRRASGRTSPPDDAAASPAPEWRWGDEERP